MTNKCTWMGPASTVETCSNPSVELFSYCAQHYPLVYRAGTAQRKRHRDIRTAEAVWDIESAFNEAVAELEAEGAI
jgi:hypothetical protein